MAKLDSYPVTAVASGDLSAKTWCFGKMTSTGIAACSSAGERADGVIGEGYPKAPTAAGQALDFYVERVVKVRTGASVAEGDELTPDTSGRAVTATTGNVVRAKALEAAGAADLEISALLIPTYTK